MSGKVVGLVAEYSFNGNSFFIGIEAFMLSHQLTCFI